MKETLLKAIMTFQILQQSCKFRESLSLICVIMQRKSLIQIKKAMTNQF